MTNRKAAFGFAALFLGVSTAAFGLPWDIDMSDGQAKKAYSRDMGSMPEGVVAQDHVLSPVGYSKNYVRGSAEGEALKAPFPATPESLAVGAEMYDTYCSMCHGADGEKLGPVAKPGRFPGVVPLAGTAGAAKNRTDGWIYLTIRNGGAIMPNYGWAMSDAEMWSLVQHVRTLKDAKQLPPKPKPVPVEGEGQ